MELPKKKKQIKEPEITSNSAQNGDCTQAWMVRTFAKEKEQQKMGEISRSGQDFRVHLGS